MGVWIWLLLELWPACPAEGWVTSEYGYRDHPIAHRRRFHYGIDIGNAQDTPVHAPWSGKVTRVSRSRGAGRHIIISSGRFRVLLAHLHEAKVSEGDWVSKGDVVGLMGHTGAATGDHLHIELRVDGKYQDPTVALLACQTPD